MYRLMISVDPDDPVAVAKQQERFALLDQYVLPSPLPWSSLTYRADILLEQQMQAVRDGSHSDLLALLGSLETRKDRQLENAKQRQEYVLCSTL